MAVAVVPVRSASPFSIIYRRILCVARRRRKGRRLTDRAELSVEEIEEAIERGRIADTTEPRATAAPYDALSDRVFVELKDGSKFEFSPRGIQGLETASAEELASVEIMGGGNGLQWASWTYIYRYPALWRGISAHRLTCGTGLDMAASLEWQGWAATRQSALK